MLWIALKSWYLWYSEQLRGMSPLLAGVVNCSQKLISLIFGTTISGSFPTLPKLWIALKSWYLWYSEQPVIDSGTCVMSCELLSKVDIFDIRNNLKHYNRPRTFVVNCSQKLISLIFGTTITCCLIYLVRLWIALKSWYLWYSEQHVAGRLWAICCCELLSKVDIFDIRNNILSKPYCRCLVVNCSQKLISLIFGTTGANSIWQHDLLWIALKSWYLWYSEQLLPVCLPGQQGCELLSKVDIFDIRNNPVCCIDDEQEVVNCSQKLISLIFGTTDMNINFDV